MEKSMKRVALLPLLLVPLLVLPFAFAAQPIPGIHPLSGSSVTTDTQIGNPVVVSGYTFIANAATFVDSGTVVGPCSGAEVVTITPDSTFTVQGTCIFTGTFGDSKTGTAVFTYTAAGSVTTGAFTGHVLNANGTAGLAGLRGVATTTGTIGVGSTYTGWYYLP
jgi:hypothetical protein